MDAIVQFYIRHFTVLIHGPRCLTALPISKI